MNIPNLISTFLKRLHAGMHHDPVRDWLAVVTVAAIALAGIVVWNVWAFDTVARGGVIGTPATRTTTVISRSSLDAIQTIFTNRAAEQAKYITGEYRYTDPSQ